MLVTLVGSLMVNVHPTVQLKVTVALVRVENDSYKVV